MDTTEETDTYGCVTMSLRIQSFVCVCLLFAAGFALQCGRDNTDMPTGPDTVPPAQPAGLFVGDARDGAVFLGWIRNSERDLAGYRIYQAVEQEGTYKVIGRTSYNYYVVQGLSYDTVYYFRITAYDDGNNESQLTTPVSAKPVNQTVPRQPQNVDVFAHNNPDGIFITLTWTPNSEGDFSYYRIYRGTTETVTADSISLLGITNTASYVDKNKIVIDTRYYYRVIAVDNGGWMSLPSFVESDVVLPKPVLVNPQPNTSLSVRPEFQWKSVSNAQGYIVFVSTARYSNEIWSAEVDATGDTLISAQYSGPTLYSGRTYYWKVGAITNSDADPNSLSETWQFTMVQP
jgi:hypothetical protein